MISPADDKLLDLLREGRVTAPFAADETGYSLQYIRDRLWPARGTRQRTQRSTTGSTNSSKTHVRRRMNTTEQRAPELHWPAGYPARPPRSASRTGRHLAHAQGGVRVDRRRARTLGCDRRPDLDGVDALQGPPNIPHQHDKPAGVGAAVRFRREDRPATEGYAIACDRWETQLENARGPVCTRGGNASPSGMASRLQTRSSRPPGCRPEMRTSRWSSPADVSRRHLHTRCRS